MGIDNVDVDVYVYTEFLFEDWQKMVHRHLPLHKYVSVSTYKEGTAV